MHKPAMPWTKRNELDILQRKGKWKERSKRGKKGGREGGTKKGRDRGQRTVISQMRKPRLGEVLEPAQTITSGQKIKDTI